MLFVSTILVTFVLNIVFGSIITSSCTVMTRLSVLYVLRKIIIQILRKCYNTNLQHKCTGLKKVCKFEG